ncbi:protein PRY2-like isoform X2 [Acropora millepora]|uniref:protein PRY2-like isoform X2 n=1 Tax=Acropora millepora TaxID=45264 RepID=UPI001CF35254|nr:protein PRY2-like isoform X2 [Acropora millepora]
MGVDHLVIKGFGIFTLFVVLAAKDQGITKITQPSSISNAAKKSTDVLIDTEAATKQEPKLVSQLTGKGTRRIEVQRPVIEDGADDAREYEEMGDDSQATDVLNEVRGQERNKEEIFDTMKQYKAEKEIQDSRRPETQVFGKEINKEKNKGLLAAALSDDDKQTGDNSDDSIAEDAVFQEALLAHNRFRALHHVLPLQWNVTLAEQAQNTAESVAGDPSTFQGEPVGENIAQIWHDLQRAPLKATTIWYAEKKTYSYSYPVLTDNVKHFTQMIWKDTTQLGMGAAPSPSGKYVIVVALYRPIGNDVHRLRDNVEKPGPDKDVYATIKTEITKPRDYEKEKLLEGF